MRRVLTITILCAMLCTAAVFGTAEPGYGIDDYEGTWLSGTMTLNIQRNDHDAFTCTVTRDDAHAMTCWEYGGCLYDEISGGLTSFEVGVKTLYTFDENGASDSEIKYTDGAAAFIINNDGDLVWTDFKESPDSNSHAFLKVPAPSDAPSPAVLADRYFRVIAAVPKETAGSSLKLATAAVEAACFAAETGLWNPDVDAFRENLLNAWESLSDDERSGFDASFMDAVLLMDAAQDDWETTCPVFDDAGVLEKAESIVFDPLNVLAWQHLVSFTLTLGNDG